MISRYKLRVFLSNIPVGQRFYIDAINLTSQAIVYLRGCIKEGFIMPVDFENRVKIKESVESGDTILPQGYYKKI